MNKKALLLMGLFTLGLCAWQAQALNTTPQFINENETDVPDPPQGYEVIELKGSLMYGINPNAIVAGVDKNAVYIQFNQNLGNVNIALYNENNVIVYSDVVDTSVQQTVIIPLSTNGTYTVELSNASGYAEGDFERQQN